MSSNWDVQVVLLIRIIGCSCVLGPGNKKEKKINSCDTSNSKSYQWLLAPVLAKSAWHLRMSLNMSFRFEFFFGSKHIYIKSKRGNEANQMHQTCEKKSAEKKNVNKKQEYLEKGEKMQPLHKPFGRFGELKLVGPT